jgi:2-keto-4-pentenoate hydratase
MPIDTAALALELLSAFETGAIVSPPPSARDAAFDINAAYAVEAEFARLRKAKGRTTTGLKVGYANKAMWRILKLDTLVWGHMYDDTVHYANGNAAEYALPYMRSPKIEPEIVFKLKNPITASGLDAVAVLEHVEWVAIGFEVIDCPYPDWQFKPADFIAGFGLHLGLVIGQPMYVDAASIPALVEDLGRFKLKVSKGGEFVEEGAGKNSLRSPALCLAELAGAVLRQPGATPLSAGDLVSSGTLTTGHAVARGEQWSVDVEGLSVSGQALSGLALSVR